MQIIQYCSTQTWHSGVLDLFMTQFFQVSLISVSDRPNASGLTKFNHTSKEKSGFSLCNGKTLKAGNLVE